MRAQKYDPRSELRDIRADWVRVFPRKKKYRKPESTREHALRSLFEKRETAGTHHVRGLQLLGK